MYPHNIFEFPTMSTSSKNTILVKNAYKSFERGIDASQQTDYANKSLQNRFFSLSAGQGGVENGKKQRIISARIEKMIF